MQMRLAAPRLPLVSSRLQMTLFASAGFGWAAGGVAGSPDRLAKTIKDKKTLIVRSLH
jgi:hypothetical protein